MKLAISILIVLFCIAMVVFSYAFCFAHGEMAQNYLLAAFASFIFAFGSFTSLSWILL